MAYQSLYRKYRPQRFGELVGQEHVTTALRNAVRENRVGHAYLFSGPRGTGKTTSARILAKALNCLDLSDAGEPCGVCDHCTAIAAGTFLDLFELDAASNRGVNDARELLERIAFRSAMGGKKVYILDEVHMLTDAAANTLLKSLEEPPDHVVFVLATTNPESVLPTIRSRTQHFEFSLLSTDQIAAHLADICAKEDVDADPEALAIVARAGAGSVRDALSLLDQALAHATGRLDAAEVAALFGGSPFEFRAQILRGIADGDPASVLVQLGSLLEAGHEPRRVADDLLRAARDAFLLTAGAGRVTVPGPQEEHATLTEIGATLGNAGLVRVIETLGQAIVDMRGIDAADPRLVLEVALVRLGRHEAGPPLVLLAERVERLERALAGGSGPLPSTPGSSAPAASPPVVKPALGSMRTPRLEPEPDPPPARAPASTPVPVAEAAAPAPAAAAPATPAFDVDDVVLAWAEILPDLPIATRTAVQHAQPIRVDGDVVVFGVAPQLLSAAQPRFRSAADAIRDALTQRLGRTPKFSLIASSEVDLSGGVGGVASGAGGDVPPDDEPPPDEPPTDLGPPGDPTPDQAPDRSLDPALDPALDPLSDEVSIDELMDAEPAGPAVSSIGLLESEFGATVVEERPRGAQERP